MRDQTNDSEGHMIGEFTTLSRSYSRLGGGSPVHFPVDQRPGSVQ